jgi:hypothetical protein
MANDIPEEFVEITRSFSRKVQLERIAGPAFRYESIDIFCSQKVACSPAEAEAKSAAVYQFCKDEVRKSLRDYITNFVEEQK